MQLRSKMSTQTRPDLFVWKTRLSCWFCFDIKKSLQLLFWYWWHCVLRLEQLNRDTERFNDLSWQSPDTRVSLLNVNLELKWCFSSFRSLVPDRSIFVTFFYSVNVAQQEPHPWWKVGLHHEFPSSSMLMLVFMDRISRGFGLGLVRHSQCETAPFKSELMGCFLFGSESLPQSGGVQVSRHAIRVMTGWTNRSGLHLRKWRCYCSPYR